MEKSEWLCILWLMQSVREVTSVYTCVIIQTPARLFICRIFFHLLIGEADEAITLYRRALQIIKDSNYMALDDSVIEKMRIDLAELLHVVGR